MRRGLPLRNGVVFALSLFLAAAISTKQIPPAWRSEPFKAVGACSAVTLADLERALGRRFGRGQEESRGGESTCDYGAGKGQVSITIQRLNEKVDVGAEIESLKKSIPDSSVRMISVLGGVAFFLDIAGRGRNYISFGAIGIT